MVGGKKLTGHRSGESTGVVKQSLSQLMATFTFIPQFQIADKLLFIFNYADIPELNLINIVDL